MTLGKDHVRFLEENDILGRINFSMDESSKNIYESIRVGLKLEKVTKRLEYFYQYCGEADKKIPSSFSFLVMWRNFTNLPGFADIVHLLRKIGKNSINTYIIIQRLNRSGQKIM